jgi:cytoskeletal protein CcmA (bactofilin family)
MASRGSESSFSVLGADLVLRGSLHAEADLHIDGTIEGDVVCKSLMQGESSTIKGSISADSVRLSGTVEGPIEAAQVVVAARRRAL